jgi:4-aminobutyrate aminotransferase-like enzyme
LFYDDPIHAVRAKGTRIWDADGREFLDCYNNVPCIGHSHPRMVAALSDQIATLNTHTRYLHDGIVDYLEDLTSTFAAGYDTGLLTCTGSEANDVAIRTAWAATGKRGIIATDATYHGNTHLVSQLSGARKPIGGFEPFVRHVPAPDSLRGADSAEFAANVTAAIADLEASGIGFAALVVCPLFANEGFPDLPKGWLDDAATAVKNAGGLLIADEVQSGFGRTGQMWAHERIGVVPDIVTLGKPMAAGHPVGGMITRRELMAAFRENYGYFNTFGGNPVSVMAAQTTLNIIRDEGLIANAAEVGAYAKSRMLSLAQKVSVIGDVRGAGLFFGAEFVTDRQTNSPDGARAKRLANAMRHRGVLLSSLGVDYATLKIRPPLVFSRADCDLLFEQLEAAIDEDLNQHGP